MLWDREADEAFGVGGSVEAGEVTLTDIGGIQLGYFNGDGEVDADDLASWKTGFGTIDNAPLSQGDAGGDQNVDGTDFLAWQRQLGSPMMVAATAPVPEPATLLLLVSGVLAKFFLRGAAMS